jgi:hypothetical protein
MIPGVSEGRPKSDREIAETERLANLPESKKFAKDMAKDAEALAPMPPRKKPPKKKP